MHRWIFLIAFLSKSAYSLYCFEGTNCVRQNLCDRCEGAACVRVARPSRSFFYISDDNADRASPTFDIDFHGPKSQVALTCLPAIDDLELEPEGCRTDPINQLRTCICYNTDYCNNSNQLFKGISSGFFIIVLFNVLI